LDSSVSRRNFLTTGIATTAWAFTPAFGEMQDLTALSLRRASELLRSKAASPVDLTQACLKRIEKYNPAVNASITVTGDSALAVAREMEAEQRRGKWRGPLHGIPIALKDNIDTAGVRTTGASELFKDRVPSEDAEVVRKLKNAGAIILGKLNMHSSPTGRHPRYRISGRSITRGLWIGFPEARLAVQLIKPPPLRGADWERGVPFVADASRFGLVAPEPVSALPAHTD
jgi:hypothetical protein